ncbi:hypothetical protein MNBD_GAMMA09-2946 [hydrothermal vent metagenome]|uniref:Lipoprotein n=1 Tax=hydrothermal vent metagenome TaxID=652676 RepID=A0A3B0YAK2_9ZZZZ
MKKNRRLTAALLSLLISLTISACDGSYDPGVSNEKTVLSSGLELQSNRLKAFDGFNQLSSSLISDSFDMLTKVETMLKSMSDSRDVLIDTLETLTQPFMLSTNAPLSTNQAVSSTTPPFSIDPAGLNNDYLLVSSSSRFLTPKNTLRTRFKTPAELSSAWLRAVEFSDQRCVYVALQSVDTKGIVSVASNTRVVPLTSNSRCSVQL